MKMQFRQGESIQEYTIPEDMLADVVHHIARLICVRDDMTDEAKQGIRSIRMLIKSALLLSGDKLRSVVGIDGKPGKKDDVVDWHIAGISNLAVDAIKNVDITFDVGKTDENAFITEIYTKSIH